MTSAPAPDLSVLGPFYTSDTHAPGTVAVPPWRPLAELVTSPDVLRDRVVRVRAGLGRLGGLAPEEIPWRVAASVAHMGVVARLLAPAVTAAVFGLPLDVDELADVHWQDVIGGPFPLSFARTRPVRLDVLVSGPLAALTSAVADTGGVSTRVLWGNVASGLNSALLQLARRWPERAPAAFALGASVLALPQFGGEDGVLGRGFRRRSCCLIYRASPTAPVRAVCGDCVLRAFA